MLNAIGSLINSGATSQEVREKYPDLPSNAYIDYFISLGYKKSSAVFYAKRLKRNDAVALEKFASETFVMSENADLKNLLLDTCALVHDECTKLIDSAEHVTITYSTLSEFDKLKSSKEQLKLAYNIRHYTDIILTHSGEKFLLSSFGKNMPKEYCDNILLDYLLMMPINNRPTLITADKNLALKAISLGLDYILYASRENDDINLTPSESDKNLNKQIPLKGKVVLHIENGLKSIVSHNPKTSCFVVRNDNCIGPIKGRQSLKPNDYWVIIIYSKRFVTVTKYSFNGDNLRSDTYNFKFLNELYSHNNVFHPKIENAIKETIIRCS